MENDDHPVYDVYDFQRTVCLNIKYYGHKLHRVENKNFWIDVIIAIAAPGSAIAGIWLTNVPGGLVCWKLLTATAAIFAVAKPFLKFPSRIKRYEHVLSGYRALMSDLEELVDQIKAEKDFTKSSRRLFDAARKKKRILLQNSPEPTSDRKLIEKCMTEVNQEHPTHNFFIPPK